MPLRGKSRFIEKNTDDTSVRRLVVTLILIFSFLILSVIFVDKQSEKSILMHLDNIYSGIDEYIEDDEKVSNHKKVDNVLESNSQLISDEVKRHRMIMFLTMTILLAVLTALLYYVMRGIKDNQEEIKNMVFKDHVTNGDSVDAFRIKIDDAIKSNPPGTYTIALLNIINFKLINSSFGFAEGDKTLQYIHYKIQQNLKDGEFLCRSDIDNFFMCLKENEDDSIMKRLLEIGNSLNDFNFNEELKYFLQPAYGYIVVNDTSTDVRIIMNNARFSCSDYKKTRKFNNYSSLVSKVSRESKLNSMFEDSLANGDFQVYLQPKVNINTEKCVGAEALIRWIHPKEGFIFPGEFIELFENNDKIIELDLYVFEEVCKILRKWIDTGKNAIPISVNLSRGHLKNRDFLKKFIAIKNKYNMPDGIIEFEILESLALDSEQITTLSLIMGQIHRNGFSCSLDDFGFGYSSLAFFSKLDVDTIKLDRRFFLDLENEKSKKVIEGFVKICENLNIKVVAEGIESEEQIEYLKTVNCEIVQGFIFSRALDVESFENSFLE